MAENLSIFSTLYNYSSLCTCIDPVVIIVIILQKGGGGGGGRGGEIDQSFGP